ncbi:MAG: VOC family protein [Chlamydiia bacterium]|nr:VOC family protein [Chlamydiia bacterium]
MIQKIKFVSIPIQDQNRALAFYTEKLGFQLLNDHPFHQEQRWIELIIPGAETQVVLFTPEGQENRIGQMMNLAWTSNNVQDTYDQYVQRGVEFIQPPQKMPWGTMALFKDSEGNVHCISEQDSV